MKAQNYVPPEIFTWDRPPEHKKIMLKAVLYWITIVVLEFVLLSDGAAELAHKGATVEAMLHLGYPLYFVTLLGLWKILGSIVLLSPRFPWLREWVYAGIFFDFSGAVVSHAACHNEACLILRPLIFALITIASRLFRPVLCK